MKTSSILLICAATVVGCGGPKVEVKGENGDQPISVDAGAKNAKVTVKDGKGNVSTVSTTPDNKSVTVKGADGTTQIAAGAQISEAQLDVPYYPGSQGKENGGLVMEATGRTVYTSSRTTDDAPEKVSEFYKKLFKSNSASNANNDGNVVSVVGGKSEHGADVTITSTRNKEEKVTTVTIISSVEITKK